MLLKAGDVTKELLNALLRFGSFPPRDKHNSAGVESVTTVGGPSNASSAETTLITQGLLLAIGHSI